MIVEEIRRDVLDKRGKVYNKLLGVALYKPDSITIEIKNRDFAEAVPLSIVETINPFEDEDLREAMKPIFKMIYDKKLKLLYQ